jgi:tetratricopeptide (TPR) repeat protein
MSILFALLVCSVCANQFATAWFYEQKCAAPLLAAAIMMRNEVTTIGLTLASLATHNITRVFLYDTGSTDNTISFAFSVAKSMNIEILLLEGTFEDFATSRNTLLRFCEFRSEWLLLLDSGEELSLSPASALMSMLESTNGSVCAYQIMQQWGTNTFYNTRLIRNTGVWYYEFPVHEYITKTDRCMELQWDEETNAVFRITQNRTISGHSSVARWHKDIDVLLAVLEKDATNPRAAFYLAQTYMQLGKYALALGAYKTRYKIVNRGWWEEREFSLQQVVVACLLLNRTHEAATSALQLYHRYSRIEGLVRVAERALRDRDFHLCYLFSHLACKEAVPKRLLFFDFDVYDRERWALRNLCFSEIDKE